MITAADGLTLIGKTDRGERLMLKMALREEAPIYLDTFAKLTNGTFDLHTIYTSWSLPFLPENGLRAFAEDRTELEITIDPVSNQCRVGGNYSQSSVTVGYGYDFAYTFSPFLVKREAQSGVVSRKFR